MSRLAFVAALGLSLAATAQSELERLVQDLAIEQGDACYQAYLELSRRHDQAMVPLLGKAIVGLPRQGRQFAVYLLRAQPISVTRAVWKKLLDADATMLRVAAAATLAQAQERGAAEALAAALRKAPENERANVVHLTYGIDHELVFAALLSWLHGTASAITVTATLQRLAEDLGRSAAVRAAAEPLVGSADLGVRAGALAFLAGFDVVHADALTVLLQAEPGRFLAVRNLLDTDRKLPTALLEGIAATLAKVQNAYEIRLTAELLRRQGSAVAMPYLAKLLRHERPELRAAALEALEAGGSSLQDKDLRAMLQDPDVLTVTTAADLLRRRDDPSGLDAVLAALPKAGGHLVEVAEVLGRFRDRRVGPVLLDLLDHADERVRNGAWNGLQALWQDLFPYRRFSFETCGYTPQSPSRQNAIAILRTFWEKAQQGR